MGGVGANRVRGVGTDGMGRVGTDRMGRIRSYGMRRVWTHLRPCSGGENKRADREQGKRQFVQLSSFWLAVRSAFMNYLSHFGLHGFDKGRLRKGRCHVTMPPGGQRLPSTGSLRRYCFRLSAYYEGLFRQGRGSVAPLLAKASARDGCILQWRGRPWDAHAGLGDAKLVQRQL